MMSVPLTRCGRRENLESAVHLLRPRAVPQRVGGGARVEADHAVAHEARAITDEDGQLADLLAPLHARGDRAVGLRASRREER